MDVDCLLLAAGASRRLGRPKLLARLGGRTVFERALDGCVESSVRRVCAVIPGWVEGFDAVAGRHAGDRVEFLALSREGVMSDSLKTGWRHLCRKRRPDAVLIALADMPLVDAGIIDSLIGGFALSGCLIGVPAYMGVRGLPAILSSGLSDEVEALEGDRGARGLIEAHGESVVEVPVDSEAILVDVDTAADLEDVKRRLGLG